MPEIKQPEQLKLDLDTNTKLFIDVEKLRNAINMLRVNVPAPDAVLVARAPQPLGRPGQRVNPWNMIPVYDAGVIEVHIGQMPENP